MRKINGLLLKLRPNKYKKQVIVNPILGTLQLCNFLLLICVFVYIKHESQMCAILALNSNIPLLNQLVE